MRLIVAIACACVVMASCKNGDEYKKYTNDPLLFSKTVKKLNNIVLENNFPPMIAARNYVYASIAAYECIVAGDSSFITLAGTDQTHVADAKAASRADCRLSFCRCAGLHEGWERRNIS